MSRIIKEFKIPKYDDYDFTDYKDNPIVLFEHNWDMEGICGKTVHISDGRRLVNIEFYKGHPLYKLIKSIDPKLHLSVDYINGLTPYKVSCLSISLYGIDDV